MLLYNITVIVEEEIAQEWQEWMQQEHIPSLMSKNHFHTSRLFKIIDSPNEGFSFCVQFTAGTANQYQNFVDEQDFTAQMYAKYPNKLLAFSTLMEQLA